MYEFRCLKCMTENDHHEFNCKKYFRRSKFICKNCKVGFHFNEECEKSRSTSRDRKNLKARQKTSHFLLNGRKIWRAFENWISPNFLILFYPIVDRLQSPKTTTEPMMIFPEDTAYAIFLNAFALFGPLFAGAASLLGALFVFTLFTFAVIATAMTFAAFALAMITVVRCKRWINPFSSRDHRHNLQHRRRHTRTRAKACPKQCCYRPDATQPPTTLGMWK